MLDFTPSKNNSTDSTPDEFIASFNRYLQSNIGLVIGGVTCRDQYSVTAAINAAEESSWKSHHKTDVSKVTELNNAIPLQAALRANSEDPCQTLLRDNIDLLHAVDTSLVHANMFYLSHKVGGTNNVYSLSGKMDLVSKLCPMFLEIKHSGPGASTGMIATDFDVIKQAAERVFVLRSTNALLGEAVVIACTARSSWLFHFERNVLCDRGNGFETLTVTRIPHEEIFKVWVTYTALTMRRPDWFWTEDSVKVLEGIRCFNNPFVCVSQLISSANHRVYGVSFPRLYEGEHLNTHKESIVGATAASFDICIKIINDDEEYAREAAATRAIAHAFKTANKEHHLITCIPTSGREPQTDHDDGEVTDGEATDGEVAELLSNVRISELCKNERQVAIDDTKKFDAGVCDDSRVCKQHTHDCRWLNAAAMVPINKPGGIIVMKYGGPAKVDGSNRQKWVADVFDDLEVIHKAGYFHCDVRTSNVRVFQNKFRLIDFDLSVNKQNPRVKFVPGWQFRCRPESLRHCQVGDTVTWSERLDYEMVLNTVI
jgi:hypothetical protein